MAGERNASTPEDGAPVDDAAAKPPAADDAASAEKAAPAEKGPPAEKAAPAEKGPPAEKAASAEKAAPDKKPAPAEKAPPAEKPAAKRKARKAKAPPKVREGRQIAGGVLAPKGAKHDREEIIARALEKIHATEAAFQPEAAPRSFSRRLLFLKASWAGFWAFVAFLGGCFGRFFFPRVLFEAPTKFRAGFPHEYAIGEVSARFKKTNRVWIVREATGFYVVFARCTHLGCTPMWLEGEQKFKCPCHGSGYTKEAINYEGPAPRPMERCYITLADDGQLLVDRNRRFLYQGPPGRSWEDEGAFLRA